MNITEAIVYTLLNSLWLGGIFALIAGAVIAATRNAGPPLRYNLLLLVIGAFVLSLLACFFYTLYAGPESAGEASLNWQYAVKVAHEHAPDIFRLWLLAILIQLAKLSLDLYTLGRLKHTAAPCTRDAWTKKMKEYAAMLGIKRKLKLAESALIRSPLVTGFLKPVILLPVGLVNNLSEKEVEMILLHELAHVRRGDFLVNIFVRLIRMLLFFNPAIWWLCKLIAAEREHCSDDTAVRISGDKLGYARALMHFAEHHAQAPVLSMTLTGGMAGRMQRLATGRNRALARIEVFCLALIFAAAMLLSGPRNRATIVSLAKPSVGVSGAGNLSVRAQQEAKRKAEAEATARKKQHSASP